MVPVAILCLFAGITGFLLLRHRRHVAETDESDWVLLLFPGGSADPLGKTTFKILRRLHLNVRYLSEIGDDLNAALTRLRPSLIVAHQPTYGEVIARLDESSSVLASTPVLLLETHFIKGHSSLRIPLPVGAKARQIGGAAVDLLSRRPSTAELSRYQNVQVDIEPGKVLEFLNFLHSMEKTGKIEIRTKQMTGVLWMEKGGIVHAVVGRLEGLEALHSMLDFVQGTIVYTPGLTANRHTIKDGAMTVLATYAQKRDELAKASGD